MERLSAKPSANIHAACRGWAETRAAYRFFAQEAVDFRARYPTLNVGRTYAKEPGSAGYGNGITGNMSSATNPTIDVM